MFGQLLFLAVIKETDLNTVFHYPILPELPRFALNLMDLGKKKSIGTSFGERKY